jgi:hypothetical protein
MGGLKLPGGGGGKIRIKQTTIYAVGDSADFNNGVEPAYDILTAGQYAGVVNLDLAHYAAPTLSFSHGARQVETATITATISTAGNATITVTAANSVALASGKAISVALALGDNSAQVAEKVRAALILDADVIAFFIVSGTGALVILTARTAAANDTAMNCASADGDCVGITAATTSANTVAGDVTTHCIYDSEGYLETTLTGNTHSGTDLIDIAVTTNLRVGMAVTGTGVGTAAVISSIDADHVHVSVVSTASATVSITFSIPAAWWASLVTIKTADTIVVHGTTNNDGVYTVATGGVASRVIVTEAVTTEAAGAYVTLLKRAAHSNNCVTDLNTGLMWARYSSAAEKLGVASDGRIYWQYPATDCTLHPAAADLQMDAAANTLKIIGGAGELKRYKTYTHIAFAGFTAAANNIAGGYRIESVAVNGADLDIVLWVGYATGGTRSGTTTSGNKVISGLASTADLRKGMAITGTGVGVNSVIASIDSATQVTGTVNSTASATVNVTFRRLATEAAGGSRSIKLVVNNAFAYAAAANRVSLGGYTDWRPPDDIDMAMIRDMEQPTGVPNATAFPSWPADYVWSATTLPSSTSLAMLVNFSTGGVTTSPKAGSNFAALLRGS